MNYRAMARVYAVMLWVTLRIGVKKMYRLNPVQSDIISTEELMQMHVNLYLEMMWDLMKGKTVEEIADGFDARIVFIQSITHKI